VVIACTSVWVGAADNYVVFVYERPAHISGSEPEPVRRLSALGRSCRWWFFPQASGLRLPVEGSPAVAPDSEVQRHSDDDDDHSQSF